MGGAGYLVSVCMQPQHPIACQLHIGAPSGALKFRGIGRTALIAAQCGALTLHPALRRHVGTRRHWPGLVPPSLLGVV